MRGRVREGTNRLWGGPALNSIPVDSCRFLLILSKTSLCVSEREYSLLRLHQLLHQRWMNRYRHRLAVCLSLRLYLRPIRWQKSDGFMISNPRKPSRSSKSPSPLQITFALPPSAQAIMSSSSGSRQTASRSVAGRTIVNLLSRMDSGRWKFTDGNCSCSLSATSRYSVKTVRSYEIDLL